MESETTAMSDDLAKHAVFDRETCFQLFALFAGDVTRTAHAIGIREIDVQRASDDGDWDKKLAAIIALRKSASPQSIERGINAALNFVLAHRFRLALARVVSRIESFSNEELDLYVFEGQTKDGHRVNKLNTRALADLASGLEKMASMTYAALGDTATERSKREAEDAAGESSGAVHAAIARAMSQIGADNTPRNLLLDAQCATAKQIVAEKPQNPNDNDDH